MQGSFGGLVVIIMYAGNVSPSPPPVEDDFLLLDGTDFLLLDGTNLLLLS